MRRRTHLCNRVLFGSNDAFSVELCSSFRMSRFGMASECLGRAERTAHIRARPILVQCRSSIEKMENSNTAAALLVRMIVILKGEFSQHFITTCEIPSRRNLRHRFYRSQEHILHTESDRSLSITNILSRHHTSGFDMSSTPSMVTDHLLSGRTSTPFPVNPARRR